MDFGYRVLTPYYTEEVLFSLQDLDSPNEDGVSILFYLQKIFPGLPILPYLFCSINIKISEYIQCIFYTFLVINAQMSGTIFLSV